MILSGLEIHQHIGKEIVINPFDESRLNPNSYNLRLADELLVYNNKVLFMDEQPESTNRRASLKHWYKPFGFCVLQGPPKI